MCAALVAQEGQLGMEVQTAMGEVIWATMGILVAAEASMAVAEAVATSSM